MISPRTARLAPLVSAEIVRGNYPFPTELVLSVIQIESRGKPGVVNPTSGASGLMQVMPGTLEWYNQHHKKKIPLSVLRTKNSSAAPKQLRVGLWVMGQFLRSAHRYIKSKIPTVELVDLIALENLFYNRGPGGTRKKLEATNTPPRKTNIERRLANWGPTSYAKKVWDWTVAQAPAWNLTAINDWVSGKIDAGDPRPDKMPAKHGLLLGLALLAVVSYFMEQKK